MRSILHFYKEAYNFRPTWRFIDHEIQNSQVFHQVFFTILLQIFYILTTKHISEILSFYGKCYLYFCYLYLLHDTRFLI